MNINDYNLLEEKINEELNRNQEKRGELIDKINLLVRNELLSKFAAFLVFSFFLMLYLFFLVFGLIQQQF